jgi:hypothetical protein
MVSYRVPVPQQKKKKEEINTYNGYGVYPPQVSNHYSTSQAFHSFKEVRYDLIKIKQ